MPTPTLETVQRAISHELEPLRFSYNERDAALYALGIGAPSDPLDESELRFVYEACKLGFQVFPTFAVIFAKDLIMQLLTGSFAGIAFNPLTVVHGEHYLELPRPLPTRATVISRLKIADIHDKGSGMLMTIEAHSADEKAQPLAYSRCSVFIRGLGGYGGARGEIKRVEMPSRSPDAVIEERVSPSQALLYRLTGDINPLHADPRMAAKGGYERPILHGLCSFGFSARAILKRFRDNEPSGLRSIGARFSHHVFPGETLRAEMWSLSETEIRFQTKAVERGALVLSGGKAILRD